MQKWGFVDEYVVDRFDERFAAPYQLQRQASAQKTNLAVPSLPSRNSSQSSSERTNLAVPGLPSRNSSQLQKPALPPRTPSPVEDTESKPVAKWGIKPTPSVEKSRTTQMTFVDSTTGKETKVAIDNDKAWSASKKAVESGASQDIAKGITVKNGQVGVKPSAMLSASTKMYAAGGAKDLMGAVKPVNDDKPQQPAPKQFLPPGGPFTPPGQGPFVPPPSSIGKTGIGFAPPPPLQSNPSFTSSSNASQGLPRNTSNASQGLPRNTSNANEFSNSSNNGSFSNNSNNGSFSYSSNHGLPRNTSNTASVDSQTAVKASKPPPPPLPTKPKKVIAIADFQTSESSDLPFNKGDLITVTKTIDENWLEGSFNGRQGMFPSSFVQPI